MKIKVMPLIAFLGVCLWVFVAYAQTVSTLEIDGQTYNKQELENQVQQLLRSGNVALRRKVKLAFSLAAFYEKQGDVEKAKELYDKALEVDSWNLKYQLRLAHLLNGTKRQQEAEEKAQLVREYAEEETFIKEAELVLKGMGVNYDVHNESIIVNKNIEIVLVPLGNVNMRVLQELQSALKELMGVNFSIFEDKKDIGSVDRDSSQTFVNHTYDSLYNALLPIQRRTILSELKLGDNDLISKSDKIKFIYAYFDKIEQKQSEMETQVFAELLKESSSQTQYDIARLIKEMKQQFTLKSGASIRGYLAVTGQDIYEGSSNFRFGGAFPGYGVMSYYRFKASFNEENQNRPRLIKRSLKQATSSAFFILGIPRCSNPLCIRAYPHSLAELEDKGNNICSLCLGKLKKYQNE